MMEFDLLGFVAHLAKLPLVVAVEQHEGMEKATKIIEAEAKAAIGEYQAAAGPFAAWAPLAPSTVDEKTRLGYAPPDNPELRRGDLRDSIGHHVEQGMMIGGVEGEVGSDSDVMVWQELGTTRMPARSILGGAAVRKTDEVVDILGGSVVMGLIGGGKRTSIR